MQYSKITKTLEDWFLKKKKLYPWRQTHDPYAILVSEIMLQQTQIQTVLDGQYYTRWLKRFPDLLSLATAHEQELLQLWQGLGYYRRARALQKAAQWILQHHHGTFPEDLNSLLNIPGVGPYTAGAIHSFAYNQPSPIVDGNIFRVISRLNNDSTPIDSKKGIDQTWLHATKLVHKSNSPRNFNAALMELGQTHCRPKSPTCNLCPVQSLCTATSPESLPIKSKKTIITTKEEHALFHHKNNKILLELESGSRRQGLWKLPTLSSAPCTPSPIDISTYPITRYKVTLHIHHAPPSFKKNQQQQWIDIQSLNQIPIGAPYKRAIHRLLNKT
jgi:A/G-specific adenine glycosylase